MRTPSLGETASADCEALLNDLLQTREIVNSLKRRLADQSHYHSVVLRVIEKAGSDLAAVKADVIALRVERHRLANEAVRATALESTLQRREEEIRRLKEEADMLRARLGPSALVRSSKVTESEVEYRAEPEAVKRVGSAFRRR